MNESHALQHQILHSIASHYITIETPPSSYFDIDAMTQVLGELIWEAPESVDIMRCKGLLRGRASDDPEPIQYMLQGVGDVFELRPMTNSHNDPGKFLFVGRGIDKSQLEADLSSCLRSVSND